MDRQVPSFHYRSKGVKRGVYSFFIIQLSCLLCHLYIAFFYFLKGAMLVHLLLLGIQLHMTIGN